MSKKPAETLIYFMQKECARSSWVEFLDEIGVSEEDADEFFEELARKMKLDKQKFYFR